MKNKTKATIIISVLSAFIGAAITILTMYFTKIAFAIFLYLIFVFMFVGIANLVVWAIKELKK